MYRVSASFMISKDMKSCIYAFQERTITENQTNKHKIFNNTKIVSFTMPPIVLLLQFQVKFALKWHFLDNTTDYFLIK